MNILAIFFAIFCMFPVHASRYYSPSRPIQTRHHKKSDFQRSFMHLHTGITNYSRYAQHAFIKHGTNLSPLTKLYFNKDEFRLSQIFENCYPQLNTEHYSPYMKVLKIKPRAHYTEAGIHFGLNAEMPVMHRWRLGFRMNIPVKTIEIERKDQGGRDAEQTQNVVSATQTIDPADANKVVATTVYRYDFLEALPRNADFSPMVEYDAAQIRLNNKTVHQDTGDLNKIGAAFIHKQEGIIPKTNLVTLETTAPSALSSTFTNLSEDTAYMVTAQSYRDISDTYVSDTATRTTNQDKKATVWVTPTTQANGTTSTKSQAIIQTADAYKKQYNSNVYEWLYDRGFELASDKKTGLGDISADIYASYDVRKDLSFEACAGVVLPTAAGSGSAANPYAVHLGNRGHTELYLGSHFSWDIMKTIFNITTDFKYHFVLQSFEKRVVSPLGSLVKNIGQSANAQVDWRYLTADFAVNVLHQETHQMMGTLAYNIYYKTEDDITFPSTYVESWTGKKYNTTSKKFSDPNNVQVDANVAQKYSQQFAHKLRGQLCYLPSEWIQLSCGCTYTFAGKNMPQETDIYATMVVKF